jgi:tetratricopeptide (TPR) repeat protein
MSFARSVLAPLIVVATIVFAHTTTVADPDPDQLVQAKAHFEQGKAYLDAKVYTKAIEEFEAAYKLQPFPDLVFNVGQAYRLANQPDKALAAYQEYLRSTPTGSIADEARVHVAEMAKQLDDDKAAREHQKAELQLRHDRDQVAYNADHEQRSSASFRRHGGYVTAGLGGAALIGGIVLVITTSSTSQGLTTGQGVGLGLVFAGFIAGATGAVIALTTDDPPGQPVMPPAPLVLGGAHVVGGSWSVQF